MSIPEYRIEHGILTFYGITDFDLEKTFDCGQCFRFRPSEKGGYEGVASGRYGRIADAGDGRFEIYSSDPSAEFWASFLSLDTDYEKINGEILKSQYDIVVESCRYGRGIRILRQDSWEAVCSFIISQNNNIPRIRKIIEKLAEKYGKPFEYEGKTYYGFPSPESLAAAGTEELFGCGTGFRAKYIHDAAEKFASGKLDTEELKKLSNVELLSTLMSVKGIGLKVASCAALYGFGRYSSFPVDVWMKKIIDRYFGGSIDIKSLGEYAGIVQQYLFYHERSL